VAVVLGEAGMGKSTLVERALAPLGAATGWCPPARNAPELWVWCQALEAAGRPDVAAGVAATLEAGPAADADAVAAARFTAVTAAARLVLQAAAVEPAVLVLEDLHWADAASLAVLDRVGQALQLRARHRLLVVATSREEAPLRAMLRRPAVVAVRLAPLDGDDVAQVLTAAGAALEPALVLGRTGGLPLLVDAVARGGTVGPTADVSAVAEGLLDQVPEPHRDLLRCAALLEDADDPDGTVLARACSATPAGIALAFDAGRAAGLVAPAGAGRRFRHVLLREAVAHGLPSHRAREVHRVAARELAARAEVDERHAAAAAAHWSASGSDAGATGEVARWSLVAGRRALRSLAPDEAVGHLARALEARRRLGAGDGDLAETLVDLAEAHYLGGAYPAALGCCEEASARAVAAGRDDLVVAASLVVRWVTYPQAAQTLARLARRALELPGLAAPARARLLAQLATMAAEDGRGREAGRLAVEALALAEADGDPLAVVDAARAREMSILDPDGTPERLRLGDLVVRHGTELRQPLGVVTGHQWRLRAAYELARPPVVEDAIRCITVLAETSGLPLVRWHQARVTAAVALLEGRFDAARAANDEGSALALESGDVTAVGLGQAFRMRLATERGDPGDLPGGVEQQMLAVPPHPLMVSALGVLYLFLDRPDDARACYERMVPVLADRERELRWLPVVLNVLELAEAFGDDRVVGAVLRELEPYARCAGTTGVPTVYFGGSPRRYLGRAYALAGRLDDAVDALRGAVDVNAALGARPSVVWSRLDLVDVLVRRRGPGDLREAASCAREAAREARRFGMPGPLARAGRLGGEVAAAERSSSPLSARETEVSELVLAGLSNRAIAQRLVLSERTVESHVSAVLRKSGVASRTEYLARRPPA
jgi:DNA-binding CsgD family transcriptional regulator